MCQKREGVISRICSPRTKEDRKTWALHGGGIFQRADWQRHKAEHPATQPWDVDNNCPRMVVIYPSRESGMTANRRSTA